MTATRTLVVLNPAAGSGRALRRWLEVREAAARNFPFDEVRTEHPGHATRIAEDAARSGVDRILAVGGDGTLHELVNGLAHTRTALGVLPCGTGNDFARSAGLLRPSAALLRALASGRTSAVDLGSVHGRYYLNVAGVGFDAEVARIVNAMARKGGGTAPYLLTAVRQAFAYQAPMLTVVLDAESAPPPMPRLLVAVGNASAYGGGMRICPRARIDDGVLDVLLAGDLRGLATLALLPRVFLGAHLGHPAIRYTTAREVHIDGARDTAVHADGEILPGLPATFVVHPKALQLWVPA